MIRTIIVVAVAAILAAAGGNASAQESAAMDAHLNKENVDAGKKAYSPYVNKAYPNHIYWGDTHLHTKNSPDAYLFGVRLSPETALTHIELGALAELWHNDRIMLAGAVEGGFSNGLIVDFVWFAGDIIDGDYRSASLVRQSDGASFGAGLRAASAVSGWGGITAIGQIGGTTIDPYKDELRWRLAANGSVDFGQRGNAPVRLSLSVDYDELTAQTLPRITWWAPVSAHITPVAKTSTWASNSGGAARRSGIQTWSSIR
jgi:hypothetical protein